MGERLEELEAPAARERQAAAGPSEGKGRKTGSADSAEPVKGKGDTRDKVSKALGVGHTKYEQAKRVVEAAETIAAFLGPLTEGLSCASPLARESARTCAVSPVGDSTSLRPLGVRIGVERESRSVGYGSSVLSVFGGSWWPLFYLLSTTRTSALAALMMGLLAHALLDGARFPL